MNLTDTSIDLRVYQGSMGAVRCYILPKTSQIFGNRAAPPAFIILVLEAWGLWNCNNAVWNGSTAPIGERKSLQTMVEFFCLSAKIAGSLQLES
ncbi:MAG TPA: hypothetical protein VE131_09555, partial [Terriglobales bacterium]|nr:hypothetical protein [Terriglobales bacterium]